jgi:hypothetical protein
LESRINAIQLKMGEFANEIVVLKEQMKKQRGNNLDGMNSDTIGVWGN